MKNLYNQLNNSNFQKKFIDIATYNQKAISDSITRSNTAQIFFNSLKKLTTCPEFYTLIFSIQDPEINIAVRKELVTNHLPSAQDDYETNYFLIILESISDFIKSSQSLEYYEAKNKLDNDH